MLCAGPAGTEVTLTVDRDGLNVESTVCPTHSSGALQPRARPRVWGRAPSSNSRSDLMGIELLTPPPHFTRTLKPRLQTWRQLPPLDRLEA